MKNAIEISDSISNIIDPIEKEMWDLVLNSTKAFDLKEDQLAIVQKAGDLAKVIKLLREARGLLREHRE